MPTTRTRRSLAALAAAALALNLLSACSSSGSAGAGTTAGASAPLFKLLPPKYQQSKKITVGADISYPPMEYYDTNGTSVIGLEKEMTDLLGAQLGVAFVWRNASFDGLITQLGSRRIDVAINGMSDNAARQARVDFVDYYRTGAAILTQTGNPQGLTTMADLCGRTIALQRGTVEETYAQDQSKQCAKPIKILPFDRDAEALIEVKSGRAVADLEDYTVAAYNARTAGGGKVLAVAGQPFHAGPVGIAIAKDNTQLRDAIAKALQTIIDNGSYLALLKKWGAPLGAISAATINAGS
jgi:polar amino acid transport system substrate-binding protein